MEGFILAAGLGTRLRPLTDDRPKALVEVGGVTLLENTLRRLEAAGVEHIVVNVHHFADKVIDFVGSRRWQARIDISDERALLLDTGGGLKKAAPLFSGREDILVHNVDILSDIDLREVERQHRGQGNLVTLCVSRRATKRMLRFDAEGRLVGRDTLLGQDTLLERDTLLSQPQAAASSPNLGEQRDSKSEQRDSGSEQRDSKGERRDSEKGRPEGGDVLAFSGISVVSPGVFALLPEADHPYPVIDEYIRLSRDGQRIGSYVHPAEHWLDVGKPETLALAQNFNMKHNPQL